MMRSPSAVPESLWERGGVRPPPVGLAGPRLSLGRGYEIDALAEVLVSNGQRVPIQQQAWKLLTILVREPGRVFPRESLYERLWPAGTFVDFEHGLNTVVRKLRRALGDSPAHPSFIETVPRRGYRFVGSAVVTDAPGCGSGQDSDV